MKMQTRSVFSRGCRLTSLLLACWALSAVSAADAKRKVLTANTSQRGRASTHKYAKYDPHAITHDAKYGDIKFWVDPAAPHASKRQTECVTYLMPGTTRYKALYAPTTEFIEALRESIKFFTAKTSGKMAFLHMPLEKKADLFKPIEWTLTTRELADDPPSRASRDDRPVNKTPGKKFPTVTADTLWFGECIQTGKVKEASKGVTYVLPVSKHGNDDRRYLNIVNFAAFSDDEEFKLLWLQVMKTAQAKMLARPNEDVSIWTHGMDTPWLHVRVSPTSVWSHEQPQKICEKRASPKLFFRLV